MDPLTLFTLASGAVSAVKKGCQLYKEIKGAAGDVKEILKDLDKQFHKAYEGKPVPAEARKQLQEEKARVIDLNKQNPDDVYTMIGEQLGAYYENYAKCKAIFLAEEKRAQEVYDGDVSIGKRALQRVLMRKKLEQMGVELRELMVYQSPPELGSLYTEVSEMMEKMSAEQEIAIHKQMEENARLRRIRKKRVIAWKKQACYGISAIAFAAFFGLCMAYVVQDRIEKYPHLGDGWIPKTPAQRALEAQPYKYVGR